MAELRYRHSPRIDRLNEIREEDDIDDDVDVGRVQLKMKWKAVLYYTLHDCLKENEVQSALKYFSPQILPFVL